MSLTYGGTEVQGVTYNGTEVQSITYNGTEVWSAIKPLANCTWSEIKEIIQAGKASRYWNVGDNKEFNFNQTSLTYNGKTYTLDDTYRAMILGFDHNKAIESNNLPNVHFAIFKNDTSKNKALMTASKTANSHGDWGSNVAMKQLFNGSSGNFYALFPTEMINVIKDTPKYYWETVRVEAPEEDGKFFLLDEYEVFGTTEKTGGALANYEKRYAYYTNGGSTIVYKPTVADSSEWWWLRSGGRDANGNAMSCAVSDNGQPIKPSSVSLNNYNLCVVPCFSIY